MNALVEFLLARIEERRGRFCPGTVIVSGGHPAPETPNCIGPTGTGCPERWALSAEPTSGWWRRPDVQARIREHELTHATQEQRFVLAECEAKRRIVETYIDMEALGGNERIEQRLTLRFAMEALALPYADHPDYDPAWSLADAHAERRA